MRHLTSLIAGIVVAIVAWGVLGWAQAKLGATAVSGISSHSWGTYGWPLLFLAVGGLLIGLIASTRISPSGPFIAGIGYLALQAMYVQWPGFLNWLPNSVAGQTDIWTRPARSGLFAVLGLAMLVAVASVRRWQRWPSRAAVSGGTAEATTGGRHQFPLAGSRPGSVTADPGTPRPSDQETTQVLPGDQSSGTTPPAQGSDPTIGHPPEPR